MPRLASDSGQDEQNIGEHEQTKLVSVDDAARGCDTRRADGQLEEADEREVGPEAGWLFEVHEHGQRRQQCERDGAVARYSGGSQHHAGRGGREPEHRECHRTVKPWLVGMRSQTAAVKSNPLAAQNAQPMAAASSACPAMVVPGMSVEPK